MGLGSWDPNWLLLYLLWEGGTLAKPSLPLPWLILKLLASPASLLPPPWQLAEALAGPSFTQASCSFSCWEALRKSGLTSL